MNDPHTYQITGRESLRAVPCEDADGNRLVAIKNLLGQDADLTPEQCRDYAWALDNAASGISREARLDRPKSPQPPKQDLWFIMEAGSALEGLGDILHSAESDSGWESMTTAHKQCLASAVSCVGKYLCVKYDELEEA